MKTENLTNKQLEVYLSIRGFIDKYGFPPSIRELCKMCGLSSPATMLTHLKNLRDKGYIAYNDKQSRTIRIIKEVDYDTIRNNWND